MTNAVYAKTSPYVNTTLFDNFLDVANPPIIPKHPHDVLFQVHQTYQLRPDLLAYDLYGDASLWWVFALRNPNTVKDPIFDMRIGNKIYLPKKTTLAGIVG